MHLEETRLSGEDIYNGRIVKLQRDVVLLENGEEAAREVIRHPGGVAVLALTDADEVLLVKQFRYPQNAVLIELPAGKLEWGESPYDCGVRELLEETGCTAKEFTFLGKLLPTPAYCTEVIHIYLARGLRAGEQNLDKDEFLDVLRLPFDKAVELVLSGEITDAKTQVGLLKLAAVRNSGHG